MATIDKHIYHVELSAREMSIIYTALNTTEILIDESEYDGMPKVDLKLLRKMRKEFGQYFNKNFKFGFFPSAIGKKVVKIKYVDKP